MDGDKYTKIIEHNETVDWYYEDVIYDSLVIFLKKNGYKIHEEKQKLPAVKHEKILTVSKYFTKEIIGIKGLHPVEGRASLLKVFDKNESTQVRSWFSDSLLNSLINFGKYYSDENAVVAVALPNVEKYKAIINRVHEYFTANNLHFKLYLVDESGDVEVLNLNDKDNK